MGLVLTVQQASELIKSCWSALSCLEVDIQGLKFYPGRAIYNSEKFLNKHNLSSLVDAINELSGCIKVDPTPDQYDDSYVFSGSRIASLLKYKIGSLWNSNSMKKILTEVNFNTLSTFNGSLRGYDLLSSLHLDNIRKLKSGFLKNTTSLRRVSFGKCTTVLNSTFRTDANKTSNLKLADLPLASSIGNYVFCNCKNLTSVDIHKVRSMGKYNFLSCTSLLSVDLSLLSSMGNGNFNYSSVETLHLYGHNGIKHETSTKFEYATKMKYIKYGSGVADRKIFVAIKNYNSSSGRFLTLDFTAIPDGKVPIPNSTSAIYTKTSKNEFIKVHINVTNALYESMKTSKGYSKWRSLEKKGYIEVYVGNVVKKIN